MESRKWCKIVMYLWGLGMILGPGVISAQTESFSFSELGASKKAEVPDIRYITAKDGVTLAFREYVPKTVQGVLVFYHGGGAHSASGYTYIASGLRDNYNIAVVTPDIRGHGKSEGERGDAPEPEQVLDDIRTMVQYANNTFPGRKVFLGGHSSGAGVILNYSDYEERISPSGYIFLAPNLGFRSETKNEKNPRPFATVKTSLFVSNSIFGTNGHSKAVFFNYPQHVLEKNPLLITAITVNMSNALTPHDPSEQLEDLELPLGVWIGQQDEVLDAQKVSGFIQTHAPKARMKILDNVNHLGILIESVDLIGKYIQERISLKE